MPSFAIHSSQAFTDRVGPLAFASILVTPNSAVLEQFGCPACCSLYHTVCLDNPADPFQGGACNMASSLAACLHSVGFEMPRVHNVVPLLDVDGVVEALTADL